MAGVVVRALLKAPRWNSRDRCRGPGFLDVPELQKSGEERRRCSSLVSEPVLCPVIRNTVAIRPRIIAKGLVVDFG